ncbi:hypothetical protein I4U23_020243 [Adineta vaga]|nr:hypothetical protein I4U23_020243 [Adineta vaga]
MISSRSKRRDTIKCHTCGQTYLSKDKNPHEELLDEQLDWLTVDHDDLRQDILEQNSRPKYHPSMSIIDHWEQESIERIKYIAYRARRTLIDALDEHMFKVERILNTLTPKLHEARQSIKSYNENNIKEWAKTLHELKQIPLLPIVIDKDNKIFGITVNSGKSTRSSPSKSITFSLDSTSSTNISNENQYLSRNITPGGVLIIRDYECHNDNSILSTNRQSVDRIHNTSETT